MQHRYYKTTHTIQYLKPTSNSIISMECQNYCEYNKYGAFITFNTGYDLQSNIRIKISNAVNPTYNKYLLVSMYKSNFLFKKSTVY